MPLYTLECDNCGHVEEDVICSFDAIKKFQCSCCGKMKFRNIGFCSSFELKYNPKTDVCGWGFDNYATSQYYKDVNSKNEAESKSIVSGPGYTGKKNIYKASNED